MYADPMGGETRRTEFFSVSDTGKPGAYVNTATLLKPLTGDPTRVMTDIDEFFVMRDRSGIGEALIVSPWPTPDLRSFGWKLAGHPPIHLLPAGMAPPAPPASLRITNVTSPEDLKLVESIAIEGHPFPKNSTGSPGQFLPPSIVHDPRLHISLG